MTQAPWWTFPRIDNFGQIDPQGDYYKPDTNVLTPYGYPVLAGVPGTVTSVQRTGYGQSVVTIKLDNPLNSLATHTFFEHMHDATVVPGQHVTAGTQVGDANLAGEGANLGFGLYPGDVYGSGSAWPIEQQDLAPGGAGLLNPISLINQLKLGITPTGSDISGGSTIDPNAGNEITVPNLGPIAVKAGLFLVALILVGFGFYVLFEKQIDSGISQGIGAAKTAAKWAVVA